MIDAQTAGILQAVNSFTIKQRIKWAEAITQGCCEQSNTYDIFDASNGTHLFTAQEKSEGCERMCCDPQHSLYVEFKAVLNQGDMLRAPKSTIQQLPSVFTAEREGCCSKMCLGCCVCNDSCKQEMFVHAGGIPEGPIGKGPKDKCIGYITQPVGGGGFTPTINIMERAKGENAYGTLAKVE